MEQHKPVGMWIRSGQTANSKSRRPLRLKTKAFEQKQKQLLRLMAKIHRDCFKLDLEFKSAWFFPEYKAIKGHLGTDKIIFVCPNPSLGQFSSKQGLSSNALIGD
jgi:hypothetical protein